MVDVNPRELTGPYTPRESTIVDAISESRRIADQAMRNNPLVDTVIEQGFTRFRGNYDNQLYLWIGEFTPKDQNLVDEFGEAQPQRGFHLQRDDPSHNQALSMYDFDPRAGEPLRQRLYMRDADGMPLMMEGFLGGRAFPDAPIVMYPRVNIEAGMTNAADEIPWAGSGNLIGTRLQFLGLISSSGTVGITYFVRVTGIGGTVVNSPTRTNVAGPTSINEDIDLQTIYDDGEDFIDVQLHTLRASGAGTYFPRPTRVRMYSYFTRP